MKDMLPLGVAASGLAVIAVVVTLALVILFVLLRGEADYDEGNGFESPDKKPEDSERSNGSGPPAS